MNKGLLVKQVRNKLNFTQDDLGKRMFVGLQEVSRWERSIVDFPNARVFELKDWFEYLTGDKKEAERLFKPYIEEIRGLVSA